MKGSRELPLRERQSPALEDERPPEFPSPEIPILPPERATSRIVRMPEVCHRTGLSRTTIWRLVRTGGFPAPRRLSANAIGWLDGEIEAWIRNRTRCA